jgi:hypothetical protein
LNFAQIICCARQQRVCSVEILLCDVVPIGRRFLRQFLQRLAKSCDRLLQPLRAALALAKRLKRSAEIHLRFDASLCYKCSYLGAI